MPIANTTTTTEAGRVVSKKNKSLLQQARDALDAVIQADKDKTNNSTKGAKKATSAESAQDAAEQAERADESANAGNSYEARIHSYIVEIVDDAFGWGNLTRQERNTLLVAAMSACDTFHAEVKANAPQLYERSSWESAPDDELDMAEEAAIVGDAMQVATESLLLTESAVAVPGQALLRLIQPGWGSSGYYSKEVLQRDGPIVFPKNSHMYWDHRTRADEREKPEGSMDRLMGRLLEDAHYEENHPSGIPGLYALTEIAPDYQEKLKARADYTGASVYVMAEGKPGEVAGRSGRVVTKLLPHPFNSVDAVTVPGAGGKFIAVESALPPTITPTQESVMSNPTSTTAAQPDIAAIIREALAEQDKRNAAATQEAIQAALAPMHASQCRETAKRLLSESKLPLPAQKTLYDNLTKDLTNPDPAAFEQRVTETISSTRALFESMRADRKPVQGLGASRQTESGDDIEQRLAEQFKVGFGMSDKAAAAAARGK